LHIYDFFDVFVQFCCTLQNEPPQTWGSIPVPAATSPRGSLHELPSGTGESSRDPPVGAACLRTLGSVVTRQWVYLAFSILGKWGGKPTLNECCGRTFGKDRIYLMVSAALTCSSRIHHQSLKESVEKRLGGTNGSVARTLQSGKAGGKGGSHSLGKEKKVCM